MDDVGSFICHSSHGRNELLGKFTFIFQKLGVIKSDETRQLKVWFVQICTDRYFQANKKKGPRSLFSLNLLFLLVKSGARSRTRTGTTARSTDFKSVASTNSAKRALNMYCGRT